MQCTHGGATHTSRLAPIHHEDVKDGRTKLSAKPHIELIYTAFSSPVRGFFASRKENIFVRNCRVRGNIDRGSLPRSPHRDSHLTDFWTPQSTRTLPCYYNSIIHKTRHTNHNIKASLKILRMSQCSNVHNLCHSSLTLFLLFK